MNDDKPNGKWFVKAQMMVETFGITDGQLDAIRHEYRKKGKFNEAFERIFEASFLKPTYKNVFWVVSVAFHGRIKRPTTLPELCSKSVECPLMR